MKCSPVCVLAVSLAASALACVGDDSSDGADDSSEGGDPEAGEVPGDPAYCGAVVDWDDVAALREEDILMIVNRHRSEGADCRTMGVFGPAAPLAMNGRLRCAARSHSRDMVDNDYFDHTSLDGKSPGDRVDMAEYAWSTWGENIAGGSPDPEVTMEQWMNSDGHCANIMNPDFTELGVGYVEGGTYGHTWTQVFGAPL